MVFIFKGPNGSSSITATIHSCSTWTRFWQSTAAAAKHHHRQLQRQRLLASPKAHILKLTLNDGIIECRTTGKLKNARKK
jgi:hypothetical protein